MEGRNRDAHHDGETDKADITTGLRAGWLAVVKGSGGRGDVRWSRHCEGYGGGGRWADGRWVSDGLDQGARTSRPADRGVRCGLARDDKSRFVSLIPPARPITIPVCVWGGGGGEYTSVGERKCVQKCQSLSETCATRPHAHTNVIVSEHPQQPRPCVDAG